MPSICLGGENTSSTPASEMDRFNSKIIIFLIFLLGLNLFLVLYVRSCGGQGKDHFLQSRSNISLTSMCGERQGLGCPSRGHVIVIKDSWLWLYLYILWSSLCFALVMSTTPILPSLLYYPLYFSPFLSLHLSFSLYQSPYYKLVQNIICI